MNIVQVTEADLPGKIFNGYELAKSLNKLGYNASQIVIEKYGNDEFVKPLLTENEKFVRNILKSLENELSMNAGLFPYGNNLLNNCVFNSSDIVHYHLIHNNFLSINDFQKLTNCKKSVWTIHDPWLVTGHCIYPLECENWKEGCYECKNLNDTTFRLKFDKANELWRIKRNALKNVNIDLVVGSDFMLKYLKNSPITKHMDKIHKIPFGIDLDKIDFQEKSIAKKEFNIPENNIVIGFRNESNSIKGVKYICEALMSLESSENVILITVGNEKVPIDLKEKFKILELGWQNDEKVMNKFYNATDIFLMPSLAETFGLMAIEAMVHECNVIVFKDTVLEEITFSNKCGIAVKYKSSYELANKIQELIYNKDERIYRGKLGKEIVSKYYKYSDYIDKHIKLYENIFERNKENE